MDLMDTNEHLAFLLALVFLYFVAKAYGIIAQHGMWVAFTVKWFGGYEMIMKIRLEW